MYTRNTTASIETLLFFLIFFIWMGFSIFALYFVASRGFMRYYSKNIFCDLFSFIFLSWFLIPLAGYRTNESYDLGRLRHFPLPAWKVFWANLLGSFMDLSVLLPLTALLAVFFAAQPSPGQIPFGIVLIFCLFFLLIVTGLTLVNFLYILLPRLNLVSAGTTILFGLFIWALLIYGGLIPHPAYYFNWFVLFVPKGVELFKAYPYGQIAFAVDDYLNGEYRAIPASLLGFAAWTIGVLFLNFILISYLWESDETKNPGVKRRTSHGPDQVSQFLGNIAKKLSAVFGSEAAAMFKKDMLEFWARNPHFFIYKILPGTLAPVIILLAMNWNLNNAIQMGERVDIVMLIKIYTVGLVLFIVAAQGMLFAGNQFGFEGENIRTILALPTPRQYILIGKNIFLCGLFMIDALVMSLALLVYFPSVYSFFSWLTLLITMFLLILALGNFTSSVWPYWMPLDKPSFTFRTTVILGLVNMIFSIALAVSMLPAIAMIVFPYIASIYWLGYILMPVAIGYGIFFHRITLKPAVNLLATNEFLVLRRVADREQL